jgi:hypothetical protein
VAKQRYGINDAYRGTVGTVIGYQWRGRWCLRARPRQVRNPRTAGQRAARGLFSLVSQLASHFAPVLRIGLHGEAVKAHRTECNHFMSVNNPCFTLEGGRLAVDYEGLVIAQGPVAPVGFGVPTAAEGRTVVVPFEKNPQHLRADGDDQVYLYAWCAALDEGVLSVPSCRRCRRAEIALPAHWAGNEVYLYGFVKDYAGRASDSVCLGSAVLEYAERGPKAGSAGSYDSYYGGGDNNDRRDSHPAARTELDMLAAEHDAQIGEKKGEKEQRPEGFVKAATQHGDEAHTHTQEKAIDAGGHGEEKDTGGSGIEVESHRLRLASQIGKQLLDSHNDGESQEYQCVGLGKSIGINNVGEMEIIAHQHAQQEERHMDNREGEGDQQSRHKGYRNGVGTTVHQYHGTDSKRHSECDKGNY